MVIATALGGTACGRLGFDPDSAAPDGPRDATLVADAATAGADACGAACAPTTYTWSELAPAASPGVRIRHAMAYDATAEVVILIGGSDGTAVLPADTWAWDGATWTDVTPAVKPPGRFDAAFAADPGRGQLVLFGGVGADGPVADTWIWEAGTWRDAAPPTAPPPRYSPTLAREAAGGRLLLFGGGDGGKPTEAFAETWAWDGTTWTELAPATSPPARDRHALVDDPEADTILTYGGVGADGFERSDTWLWDGATWLQRVVVTSPGPRHAYALVADRAHRRVLLFGGRTGVAFDGTTWAWDATTWTEVALGGGPAGRQQSALAYDAARGQVVMYGGHAGPLLADTWVLSP
jgi:hypothetical protein